MPVDAFQSELIALLPRMRRFACALTRQMADADDIVQLAAERALKSHHQWQAGTRLDSWLFRIIRNAWIDETRARGRRDLLVDPDADGAAAGIDPTPALEARIDLGKAQAAMDRLPPEQREAIALVLVEGLGYAEAAAVLDIPLGTLTSRLLRGRAALARMLTEGADAD